MNRLTKLLVDESFNSMEMRYKTKNNKMAINKLGQLEDIEEELGIDLITLFKALNYGIWCWNDKGHEEYFFEKPLALTKFVTENKYDEKETETYRLVGVDYYELKDYGKTWALTKEELENGKD